MSKTQPKTPEVLDTVETPEGTGTVVGIMDGTQVEVRYPGRNLKMWAMDRIKVIAAAPPPGPAPEPGQPEVEIATPQAADEYRRMREQGLNPTVPAEAFGDEMVLPPPVAKRSTIAQQVADSRPRSKSGRPLSGAALAKHQARKRALQDDDD